MKTILIRVKFSLIFMRVQLAETSFAQVKIFGSTLIKYWSQSCMLEAYLIQIDLSVFAIAIHITGQYLVCQFH